MRLEKSHWKLAMTLFHMQWDLNMLESPYLGPWAMHELCDQHVTVFPPYSTSLIYLRFQVEVVIQLRCLLSVKEEIISLVSYH